MKITLLMDNPRSWFAPYADKLEAQLLQRGHNVLRADSAQQIEEGDCVFFLSCEKIVPTHVLKRNRHNLVIHASALPKGKGMSPLTWQIVAGESEITVTLLEASEKADSGVIYLQDVIRFAGHELIDELREKEATSRIELALRFIDEFGSIRGVEQVGEETFYPRRTPADSKVPTDASLSELFNRLRVADNERYPAFFEHLGHRYTLKITKQGPANTPKASTFQGSKSRPRLLFTGGGGSASQSLQAQWGKRYDLWFADANPHGFPPTIPENRRVIVPFASDAAFAETVLLLCQKHGIDLIVPCVDEELLVLAQKKDVLGWPRIMVPSAEFVSLMLDKLACAASLVAAGLDAPKTLPLARATEIDFPLIAKPRSGRGSRGVMRLTREEQVDAYLKLQGGSAKDYIAQELAPGAEYTVFVAADGGDVPQAVIPVLAYEKRGVTVRARTDANAAIIAYARAFQAHFRASGCYNIQCMLTPDGRVLPFEVNPRVSTTFVLAIATGFDPIPMALGQKGGTMFVPSRHLTLQRSWHTHIAGDEVGF